MRILFLLILFVALSACKKDNYICPESDVMIESIKVSPFSTTIIASVNNRYWQVDSAHIKGDSIYYYIAAPLQYDCAYLYFNTTDVYYLDSFPSPFTSFSHVIRSRDESLIRKTKLFAYDISFLDEYFTEDSIMIKITTYDTTLLQYYYR